MARDIGRRCSSSTPRAPGIRCPTSAASACARGAARAARAVPAGERALLLLSGGASALVAAPVDGLTLEELVAATRALLHGGASIGEINVVRRHLTKLGGGKLAAACAGAIDVLALSDVAGDDPATIGSGPASPEPSTRADGAGDGAPLRRARRGAARARARRRQPARGSSGVRARQLSRARFAARRCATRRCACVAAAGGACARGRRWWPGDVDDFAVDLAAEVRALRPGDAVVAVGEPTVRVRGGGLGGRAQHLALAMVAPLSSTDAAFVALGSDGRDGPTDAAGALVDGRTLPTLAARGIDAAGALERLRLAPRARRRRCAVVAALRLGHQPHRSVHSGVRREVVFARRVDHPLACLQWTEKRFTERGLATPRLDAQVLLAHVLQKDRVYLYTHFDQPLGARRARRAIARSSSGGSAASRWPTSSAKKSSARSSWRSTRACWCRAPTPRPPSTPALALLAAPRRAARRRRRHRLGRDRARAQEGAAGPRGAGRRSARRTPPRSRAPTPSGSGSPSRSSRAICSRPWPRARRSRVIVSNPPYIPTGELAALPPEVRTEPRLALDGGADGLDVIRRLVADAPPLLAAGGALVLEVGAGQAPAVAALFAADGRYQPRDAPRISPASSAPSRRASAEATGERLVTAPAPGRRCAA